MGSYEEFQELCETCSVSEESVRSTYGADPEQPWKTLNGMYGPFERSDDTERMFAEIFEERGELSLAEVACRVNECYDRLLGENSGSGSLCTAGNIRVAVARAAANALRENLEVCEDEVSETDDEPLDVEEVTLDIEEIRVNGKPSPYGTMKFIRQTGVRENKLRGEITHADYAAARTMYGKDMAAMLIAREYEMEELMLVPVEQE